MTRMPIILLSLLLGLSQQACGQVATYCQSSLTSPPVRWCIECNAKKCYYCNHLSSPIWTTTGLKECRALTVGNTKCKDLDPLCAMCERKPAFVNNKCIRCNAGYGVVNGKCVKVVGTSPDAKSNCRLASMNPDCEECHQDATCRRCHLTIKPWLSPTNAIWLDAGYPETQCTSKADIAVQAKAITGINLMAVNAVTGLCRELDTDFRCAACIFWTSTETRGYGPVKTSDPNKIDCVPNNGRVVKDLVTGKPVNSTKSQPIGQNGCYMKLPFMQYCLKCQDDGRKCVATYQGQKYGCTGGRSIDTNGLCSLNCKGLFGIGCKACNYNTCTGRDAAYATGR